MSAAPRLPLIAAHVPPPQKAAFARLAAARGMTESTLLALLVDTVLGDNQRRDGEPAPAPEALRCERLTLRLRPGDRARLAARATSRAMKPARYTAALIHAHVARDAPLPGPELHALKVAVSRLAAVHRALADVTRSLASPASVPPALAARLTDTALCVDTLRVRVAELVRCNLMSWETGDV